MPLALHELFDNNRGGLVDNWLRHVQDVRDQHADWLARVDPAQRVDALVEMNVLEQARNVCRTTAVQDAWQRDQPLAVHGWVYGLRDGLLADLGITVSAAAEAGPAYAAALASIHQRHAALADAQA